MKKILIHVRNEDYEMMEPILEDIYHIVIDRNDFVQVKAFVPDAEVNDVIDKIREPLDLRYKENLIEVSTPDFVISSVLSRAEKKVSPAGLTPIEQLLATTKAYTKIDGWSIALTSIAGLIALTGLFMNNVAIIIGAMLLSPILGPIHSFAINAAVGKTEPAIQSIRHLVILLMSVFFVSAIATFIIYSGMNFFGNPIQALALTTEIMSRTESSPIYILMAVLLGFASLLALSRDIPETIAGVAIAAALLPPTVVSGIGLVLIHDKVLNSIILVFDNVIGLIAGALIATLVLGISPRDGWKQSDAKKLIKRSSVMIVLLICVLITGQIFL